MSLAGARIPHDAALASIGFAAGHRARMAASRLPALALAALVMTAPYEAIRPILTLPGQSLTTLEAALLAVFATAAFSALTARAKPALELGDVLPWIALAAVAFVSALLAPLRGNALHMTARLITLAGVWAVAVLAGASEQGRRQIARAVVASGTMAALLVIADFAAVRPVRDLLTAFRTGIAVVGAQVRASGPFQYPTIASMYLEIVFAIGLGLLVSLPRSSRAGRAALVVALAIVIEAIVLTFTRAGLVTIGLSLFVVGLRHRRCHGWDDRSTALAILAAVAVCELAFSRSAETLMLRLTSEGQARWYSAAIDAPVSITLDTRTPIEVPLVITNTGRATWDSNAAEPIRLSYHWVAEASDDVIVWEGLRTPFREPVRAGETVRIAARVGGPGRAGRFRLMWDIEQEHRLWFSTEPGAARTVSIGLATGPAVPTRLTRGPTQVPPSGVRPGRLTLWAAAWRMFLDHPWFGAGPDNYRLLYGPYARLGMADARVHSNNMYLEVLAGMGVVGAAVLVWIGVRVSRDAWCAARESALGSGIFAACLAIAVHGLVDSFLSFTATYILIGTSLGLACACARDRARHAHRL
jgi:hypothetical protein